MERDYNGFPSYMDFMASQGLDYNEVYKDPLMNPMVQYEQAYVYYKYLCMQMDYKLKCKEYEKICNQNNNCNNYTNTNNNSNINSNSSFNRNTEKKPI